VTKLTNCVKRKRGCAKSQLHSNSGLEQESQRYLFQDIEITAFTGMSG